VPHRKESTVLRTTSISAALSSVLASAMAQTTPVEPPASAASAPAEAASGATPTASPTPPSTALPTVRVVGGSERGVAAKDASAGVLGELRLIETPYSINVLTRELIDNQQAAHYGDYLKNDPSASVGNVPVGFMNLRGFSVNTAGFLYDGLPGNSGLSDGRGQLVGVERIEVLKGPSAFLYGLGATTSLGGTLNYIPKRPQDKPVRSATLGYTSRSLLSVQADLGDRFGTEREFGYRVNLAYKDGEQAVQRYDWTHQGAALALDWRATKDLALTAHIDHADNHFPRLQPFYVLAPGLAVPKAPDASRNIAQPWDDFRTETTNAYLRADWSLAPDWSLTTQVLHNTSARPRAKEARFGSILDADGNVLLFSGDDQSDNKGDSGQVLLHGKLSTAGVEHRLTAGWSASRERSSFDTASLGTIATNLYNPVDAAEPASAALVAGPVQKNKARSLLLSDILKFSDAWSLLLGARHAKVTTTSSISKTSPTAALMFKPVGDALLYLNYSEGIEAGGTAPVGTTNANQVLAPIKTEQLELGGKLELGELTLTGALFDLKKPFEYTDAATLTYVQNGIQRHRGLELTATGRVTPDLTVVAGAMALRGRTNNTGDAATEGKRPQGVAKFSANLYGDYRLAAVPGLFVNAGAYHGGNQYLDGANTQSVPGWTRLDVGARYETRLADTKTTLLFNVENLADKSYWAGAQSGLLTLAEPRTLKLSARFEF
jgi:iron complex outermembrane recepter protein